MVYLDTKAENKPSSDKHADYMVVITESVLLYQYQKGAVFSLSLSPSMLAL